ncbi:glycosyltransferase family 2 protein [Desulfitobacterium metallireducens]|uniref:Glycosyl transferase family 2 n=1 Tax=Desulfitobacterium metallireducens DSM 15288 TaxID=871968 RepID=W0EEV9_9FIRM|nr:glycosyltransferase family 2 protein [Desulfitobacterium metallireducens]AHF08063.1 glycosyl transferase family 2 [Desulfitobacterium metallireducens DSM 15288]
MIYEEIPGVPKFECEEYAPKRTKYCICIPIINEGNRIWDELQRAQRYQIDKASDIIICDGGSTDGCTESEQLKVLGVNTLLVKRDKGKQGAQLRMGMWWALQRGYDGIVTIDGNNKDSIEDIPRFLEKLEQGYDFIQGSRYIKGGHAVNTPIIRHLSVRLIHAPLISLTAKYHFTDTTNAFRAHSRKYLEHPEVQPFRDIFMTYELLAYLSVRATQLGLKVCELPVTRAYPKTGKTPTKISFLKGNSELMSILLKNLRGEYKPKC